MFGKSLHPRYSVKAVEKIQDAIKTADIDEVWARYWKAHGKKAAAARAAGTPAPVPPPPPPLASLPTQEVRS